MFAPPIRTFLTAICLTAISASAAPGLSLSLSGADSVVDVNNLEVAATLTNTGDQTLKILNDPSSILSDKFATNSFTISSESGSPRFIGAKVKYVPEQVAAEGDDSAFTVLAPGESVTVAHNLGSAYNFTTSGEAAYTIVPSDVFHIVDLAGSISPLKAETAEATHVANLTGTLALARHSQLSKRIAYNGCSSSRQTTIVAAASAANAYASNTLSYLRSLSASSARWDYWFGAYSSANDNTVTSHFASIADYDYNNAYTYDCTCTEANTFAYVYADEFGTIYLCPVFWRTGTTGTDSRAGTLIHEASHFTAIAGTDDLAYGQTNAHNLAVRTPSRAIINADNHEYFAENTPTRA